MNRIGRSEVTSSKILAAFVAVCFGVSKVSRGLLVERILAGVAVRRYRTATRTIGIVARSFHFERLLVVLQVLEASAKKSGVWNIVACPYIPVAGAVTVRRSSLTDRNERRSTGVRGAFAVMIVMMNVLLNRVRDRRSQRDLFFVDELTAAAEFEAFVHGCSFVHRFRGVYRRAWFLERRIRAD